MDMMDNDTASESNKPVNEGKTKNSAKISDDELILRRKRKNAENARAYRERKKALGLQSSSQAELNSEPPEKQSRLITDAMPSTSRGPASSPGYNTSIVQSGEPVSENIVAEKILHQKQLNSENIVAEKILHQKQLNAERCRRYRQKCKWLKWGASYNQDILPIRTESTPEALKTIKLLALKDSTRDKIVLIDYEMKSLNTTKAHLEEAGDHVCGVCNERFNEESLLRLHEEMHKMVFKCTKCADVCLSEESARQHYERCVIKRSKLYKCNKCVMQFTIRNEYHRHIRRAHVSVVFCDHCGKPFTDKSSLVRHLLIHSGNVPMFECKICKKKCRRLTALYQHTRTHNNEIDQAAYCAECNVQFKNKHHYQNHLRYSRNHIKEQDLKIPCPHCEKRFNSNSHRKDHIESMHSNEANYHCDECEKSFKALRRLREHVRSAHKGYKRPSNSLCVVCGRKFQSKTTLNEHMNSHTGTRPFDCETCGATFAYSAAFYTHKKKHKRCRALLEQQKTKRETNSDGNVEQTDS